MAVDLAQLNPPQREAAGHREGPLLILAGAGSGKTRVITFRIAHLLATGVPPEAICAVTFTNKAAEEMRERVGALVNNRQVANKLTIGTFHALGLQVLRMERKALGVPRGFTIYDASDQMGLVREAMRAVHDGDRRLDAKAIMARISLAKNAFLSPEEYETHHNAADDYDAMTVHVYPRYQEQLRASAAFDFDDLIVEPVRLWEKDPDAKQRWSSRFRFVMVDEFQDTNRAQLRMVQTLVDPHQNLVVVGDDDQSIYSWRGADPTNILDFGKIFPSAKIVKLEQNYRSTKSILAAANTVIANNKNRHGKTLWSQLGDGEIITHAVAATAEAESQWIAREIKTLVQAGRRYSDIAILYRSNIQSKLLEEELRTHEVPYTMYGGQQFYERKEVKDVIAYMRCAVSPRDELAIRRVINYPTRGVGAQTIEKVVGAAHGQHIPLWDALESTEVSGPARTGIEKFRTAVLRVKQGIESGQNLVDVAKGLIEDIGLYDDLRAAAPSMTAAQRRIDNVQGLLNSLQRFLDKGKGIDKLAEYLRHLSLDSSSDDKHEEGDRIVLTTLHGAKGLEFPVCFMIGLEEELLPHARTLNPQATDVMDVDHATDVSEERRLCYVGITRAQRKLYLTRAATRITRGRVVARTPSRFLLEIPDELLEVRDLGEEAREEVPKDEVVNFFANFNFDD